jgi:TonB family protein
VKRFARQPASDARDDRFRRSLVWSTGLHMALVLGIVVSPAGMLGSDPEFWGTDNPGAINVGLAGSVSSGIPLPDRPNATPDGAGTESPGRFEEVPPPPAPEPPAPEVVAEAEPIPANPQPDAAPPPPAPDPEPDPAPPAPPTEPDPDPPPAPAPTAPGNTRPSDPPANIPDNAVPFGQGPGVALPTGQGGDEGGAGLAGVGDGAFGVRFGTYVDSMQRAISRHWLQANIDPSIRSAPRVYLTFRIDRSGRIANVEVEQSSGNTQVDRSAQRALQASSPLPELPREYEGRYVDVRFWFELRR